MKGKRRRRHAHYAGPPSLPAEQLAAQLAPAEERDRAAAARPGGAQANGGSIVVDKGAVTLAEGFGAARKSTKLFNDRVVVVIIALVLLFTAFIAWQVSRMADEPTPVRVIQE